MKERIPVVERAKVKYTTFKRNISFIRGNSGTGKTTLFSMIRDYNDRGPKAALHQLRRALRNAFRQTLDGSYRSSKIQSSF
ncbi:MAG: hypothetical protein ACLTYW_01580 [Collinsella sp.]